MEEQMTNIIRHRGQSFKKSSFSPKNRHCVAVSIQESIVLVMNSHEKQDLLRFSKEEWQAFIKGVKAGEFDMGG
jgi:predicted secreted Zn-dependent protease